MTAANKGNWQVRIGTNASPQVLTEIEEVLELDGFGAVNELIEVTNFDTTAGEKEFIGGLAEGEEFTVLANMIAGASAHQAALRDDKGNTRLFDVTYTGSSPNHVFSGVAVNMGWRILPSLSEQNQIEFRFKVSGAITETP